MRRQTAKLRIVFERTALLCGRQVFVAAEPVPGVARQVLRRMRCAGMAGTRMFFWLKVVPLSVGWF